MLMNQTPQRPSKPRYPRPYGISYWAVFDAILFGIVPIIVAIQSIRAAQQFVPSYTGPMSGLARIGVDYPAITRVALVAVNVGVVWAAWAMWHGSDRARGWLLRLVAILVGLPVVGLVITVVEGGLFGAFVGLFLISVAPHPALALLGCVVFVVQMVYLNDARTLQFFDRNNPYVEHLRERLMRRAQAIMTKEEFAAWQRFVGSSALETTDPLALAACRKFDADPEVQMLAVAIADAQR